MGRPKGAKNKTIDEKVQDIIAEVKELKGDDTQTAEAIDELEDLLLGDVPSDIPEYEEPTGSNVQIELPIKLPKTGTLLGYHPATGAPVYQ